MIHKKTPPFGDLVIYASKHQFDGIWLIEKNTLATLGPLCWSFQIDLKEMKGVLAWLIGDQHLLPCLIGHQPRFACEACSFQWVGKTWLVGWLVVIHTAGWLLYTLCSFQWVGKRRQRHSQGPKLPPCNFVADHSADGTTVCIRNTNTNTFCLAREGRAAVQSCFEIFSLTIPQQPHIPPILNWWWWGGKESIICLTTMSRSKGWYWWWRCSINLLPFQWYPALQP